jgi:two-component system response regulator CpxR
LNLLGRADLNRTEIPAGCVNRSVMNIEPTSNHAEPNLAILLIDDDLELCDLIREFFRKQGFSVDAAHDGRRGLAQALRGMHDLILLDVMLPGLDGFELLRQVRRRSVVPIIMLTARTSRIDRVTGLDAGADDYLPKPFDPEELVARIRAVLRRTRRANCTSPEVHEVNGVKLVPGTREVWAAGRPVDITTTEFDILELMVRAAGRIISRDELSAVIYRRPASSHDRSLDVHVSHLRKKLGPLGGMIRTVRGVGYLFCAEVNEHAEARS